MKRTKTIAGLLLALIMIFVTTSTVFAAGTNSIKVTGAQKGETYKIYKMLDLKVNVAQTAYSYKVNSNWTAFFTTGAGKDYVDIDDQGYVTWKTAKDNAADWEDFGKAAAAAVPGTAVATQTPDADGDITFANLESGYYLITSTNGTLSMVKTTPKDPEAVINEKNADATLAKQVQEDSNSTWGTENSAQIGNIVEFKVEVAAKKGAKNYVIHDTMDDGLTFNPDSVAIAGLTKDTDYTVETAGLTDECTFEIRFVQNYLNTITGDTTLTVTYDALLDKDADVDTGEHNKAKLAWGDGSETELSSTVTKTYKFAVLKYDAKDGTKAPLAGATFQLKNAEGNVVDLIKISDTEYRVSDGTEDGAVDSFTTVAAGNIVIKGVDLDGYTLVETQAPEGYNTLKDPKAITVTADNALVVEIPNASGVELPSTGGIGTTIFYVSGAVLLVGAAVLLVVRKRVAGKCQ